VSFRLRILPDTGQNDRRQYLQGLALVTAVSLFCHTFSGKISEENLTLLYVVSVMLAALYLGEGPTLLVALASFIMLVFGILDPKLEISEFNILSADSSWRSIDSQNIGSLAIFLFVGYLVSNLSNRLRGQARLAQTEENNARHLLHVSQQLSQVSDVKELVEVVKIALEQAYPLDCYLYLHDSEMRRKKLNPKDLTQELPTALKSGILLAPDELVALEACLRLGRPTGALTDLHSFISATFYPIKTPRQVLAVVRLSPFPGKTVRLTEGPERNQSSKLHFESLCNQAALAIEQLESAEQTRQAELLAETERLQSTILNSISHDLQTPLASISGSLQLLLNREQTVDEETELTLLQLASDQTSRLRRLVSNLLQITRLEGGGLRLNFAPLDPGEVFDLLKQNAPEVFRNRLSFSASDRYLEFEVDGVLWLSVLMNLLENAAKYSPADQNIDLSIERISEPAEASHIQFRVSDRGAGVPDDCKQKIFERFYRLDTHAQAVGSGLGLYITKAIVEAHSGRLWVEDRPEGGSIFVAQVPQYQKAH
jgi:two-component system, OmpR family, sensor histidine kinase KdpD